MEDCHWLLESERTPEHLPWLNTALGSLRLNLRSNGLHITILPSSPLFLPLTPLFFLFLFFCCGIGMEKIKDSFSQTGSYVSWYPKIYHNSRNTMELTEGFPHIPGCPWLLPMTLSHADPGCGPGQKEK